MAFLTDEEHEELLRLIAESNAILAAGVASGDLVAVPFAGTVLNKVVTKKGQRILDGNRDRYSRIELLLWKQKLQRLADIYPK